MSTPAQFSATARAGFREFMSGQLNVVCIVTAFGPTGARGLTCTSVTGVSLDPPILSACITTGSRTLRNIRSTGTFGVNMLHAKAIRTAELFAAPEDDQFSRVPWAPAFDSGVPHLVRDAFALAGCTVERITTVGDHDVVFGLVSDVRTRLDQPLVHGRRSFWDPVDLRPLAPARAGLRNADHRHTDNEDNSDGATNNGVTNRTNIGTLTTDNPTTDNPTADGTNIGDRNTECTTTN